MTNERKTELVNLLQELRNEKLLEISNDFGIDEDDIKEMLKNDRNTFYEMYDDGDCALQGIDTLLWALREKSAKPKKYVIKLTSTSKENHITTHTYITPHFGCNEMKDIMEWDVFNKMEDAYDYINYIWQFHRRLLDDFDIDFEVVEWEVEDGLQNNLK